MGTPKLHIECLPADRNWLQYLVEEFQRIQEAQFDVQLNSNESSESSYSLKSSDGEGMFEIPRGVSAENTQVPYPEFKINSEHFDFDIFWMSFTTLSRVAEWKISLSGKQINSNSFNHPQADKIDFNRPFVNECFAELERMIKLHFPHLKFGNGRGLQIDLSHDLDYLKKTLQLRIKQTAFNGFNLVRTLGQPKNFFPQLKKTSNFLLESRTYWCFDFWKELEEKANQRSTFYVYANAQVRSLKTWILDPSYNISSNARLVEKLKSMHSEGFEIGLHGSFNSAEDFDLLKMEKDQLEDALGLEVSKTRQHWLRYNEQVTPRSHSALFKFDSTIGWNDRMGFRAGIGSVYRPFDHENQKPFDHFVIPLLIMDSNIYDYGAGDIQNQIAKGAQLLSGLKSVKNAHVSISWHPRTCSSDYNWHPAYEQYLRIA
jgi:hypothetical protein